MTEPYAPALLQKNHARFFCTTTSIFGSGLTQNLRVCGPLRRSPAFPPPILQTTLKLKFCSNSNLLPSPGRVGPDCCNAHYKLCDVDLSSLIRLRNATCSGRSDCFPESFKDVPHLDTNEVSWLNRRMHATHLLYRVSRVVLAMRAFDIQWAT